MPRKNTNRRRKTPTPALRVQGAITALGPRGEGRLHWFDDKPPAEGARATTQDGARIAHVPCTVPGDTGIFDVSGDRGQLVSLSSPGPDRRPAPCPHFGSCGGCALQHLQESAYRDFKVARIRRALSHHGFMEAPIEPMRMIPERTRRRAVFALTPDGAGFNKRASHAVVTLSDCLIVHPDLEKRLGAFRALAALLRIRNANLAVTLCDNGLDIDLRLGRHAEPSLDQTARLGEWMRAAGCVRFAMNGAPVLQLEDPVITADGLAIVPPVGGFLQASAAGEAALLALVKAALADFSPPGARASLAIADLFCGSGTFALPLAKAHRVTAIDSDGAACRALKDAAGRHQHAGALHAPVTVVVRNLFERPLMRDDLKPFDAVVFDPPRAGAQAQSAALAQASVPLIIAVSCNPETFARDAATLAQGGYTLARVTPVDQFVYAAHVELVSVFTRNRD